MENKLTQHCPLMSTIKYFCRMPELSETKVLIEEGRNSEQGITGARECSGNDSPDFHVTFQKKIVFDTNICQFQRNPCLLVKIIV